MPNIRRTNTASASGEECSTSAEKNLDLQSMFKNLQEIIQSQLDTHNINMQKQFDTQNTNLQDININIQNLQCTQGQLDLKFDNNSQRLNTHIQDIQGQLNIQKNIIEDLQTHMINLQEETRKEMQKYAKDIQTNMVNLEQRMDTRLNENIQKTQDLQIKTKKDLEQIGMLMENKIQEEQKEIQNQVDILYSRIRDNKEDTKQIQGDIIILKEDSIKLQVKVNLMDEQCRTSINKLQQEESDFFENIRSELEQIKRFNNRVIFNDRNNTYNPYLKPQMWPKYRDSQDQVHAMTYLKNIKRLTMEIEDDRQKMNLIRLTLEGRALEWFEMAEDRCDTFEQFEKEFVLQYWNKNIQDRTKVNLLTGRYQEGIVNRENYARDMFNKSKHLPGMSEEEIVRHILNHFIITDGHVVISKEVTSIEELMETLRRLDDLTDLQRQNLRINDGNNNYGSRSNYNGGQSRGNFNNYGNNNRGNYTQNNGNGRGNGNHNFRGNFKQYSNFRGNDKQGNNAYHGEYIDNGNIKSNFNTGNNYRGNFGYGNQSRGYYNHNGTVNQERNNPRAQINHYNLSNTGGFETRDYEEKILGNGDGRKPDIEELHEIKKTTILPDLQNLRTQELSWNQPSTSQN
ncbi:hypothetical protein MML48_10g00018272 [Holotrichia oblita]|uniref:Uncharacterized protein n=1 Tax=Holotrichia oblita TaxID=644536 RepID=A0ACB9SJR1_HOLOL|nr:hypothetical protein MML48_10g00018272 [Holotrichia oblita]